MAKSITIYPLGVGDAFTEKFWYSNMILNVDGRELFIDCPAYIPKMLSDNNKNGEKKVTLDRYKELIITHMHADHVGGVEELAYWQYFKTDNPIKLYAPKWLLQDLWTHLRTAMEESARGDGGLASMDWFFEAIPLQEKHDFGGFTVETHVTKHFPRTVAYMFDFGNFKFGYSSDTGFDRNLIEWLDRADVILHECRFGPTNVLGGDLNTLHSSIADMLTLPESFQRKTHLYHYADDTFDDDPLKPNYEIGQYRLLVQNKTLKLL